jgi:hypothetical protein
VELENEHGTGFAEKEKKIKGHVQVNTQYTF